MTYSIDQINQIEQTEFVHRFGAVFEETPEIAAQAWQARPFQNLSDLHQKMIAVVENMTPNEKIQLINAHPELGRKGKMAEASVQEQTEAGLTQLESNDHRRIQALNSAYREKFGFPFVMAVKGCDRSQILTAFEARLKEDPTSEMARSLAEIHKIARFRLEDLIN